MTKVCHMTSVHALNDTRIFIKECKTLRDAGYDVTLIVQHDKDEIIDGIFIKGIDKPKNRCERMLKSTRQVYQRALECDADIYHFHDPELIPVGLLMKNRGKKVIYDVHEAVSEDIMNKEWISKPLRKTISFSFDRLEWFVASKFDGIVAATPKIMQQFIYLNPNVININNFPIINFLAKNIPTISSRSMSVAYIGAIGRIRGIKEMLQALEKSEATLLLAGTFTTREDYDIAIYEKGWEKTDYRGQVSKEEVSQLLNQARAGLVLFHPGPNHDDSQPNKLFEYMAAGIPVIGSNFPLWKEIIEANECGICVDPLNPEEIAGAINWIIDNPDVAEQMGRNGLRAVQEKYNWETEGKKLVRFYEELLNEDYYRSGSTAAIY